MLALQIPRYAWRLAALLAMVAAGLVLLAALQVGGLIDRQEMAAGAGVLMLAVAPLSLPWWRAVGEPAREAHKSASYWGGLIGFALTGYVALRAQAFARLDLRGLAALWLNPGPQAAGVTAGAMFAILAITAGYAVAWSAWWLRRR